MVHRARSSYSRTMTDWAQLYRDHVAAVSALASDLSDDELATVVPGSPEWSVHEVVAHMAGVSHDTAHSRTDGAPSGDWTERHVAERRDKPVPDLLAELADHQDAVAASTVDNPTPAVVWDIAVHHADLHEALGKHRLPDHFWTPIVDLLGPRMAPDAMGVVAPYEIFRGLFSRRSRAQMQGWDVPMDPEALDRMCIFGPRDDDQPVPA